MHSSLATRYSFFFCSTDTPVSMQVSDPFNFTLLRELVLHAKPSKRVSTPSCKDRIPWKLFLLFISLNK